MSGAVLTALLPVMLLIGLGAVLRRRAVLQESFWPQAERLCYYILLPALFVQGLATARLEHVPVLRLMLVVLPPVLLSAALLWVLRPRLPIGAQAFTSVFQGSIRFNNYVGVTLAAGLFAGQGVALAALCNAILVPAVNLLCVLVFVRCGGGPFRLRTVLAELLRNPLILSCLLGTALQMLKLPLPVAADTVLRGLGAASMPLGLLCVGAALRFTGLGNWILPLTVASLLKFLLLPLLAIGCARLTGLEGAVFLTGLLFLALPTASSSYILARQLGGDAPLMAGLIAVQTVLAVLTIPAVVALAGLLGAGNG